MCGSQLPQQQQDDQDDQNDTANSHPGMTHAIASAADPAADAAQQVNDHDNDEDPGRATWRSPRGALGRFTAAGHPEKRSTFRFLVPVKELQKAILAAT
jgi:hypothetical protein